MSILKEADLLKDGFSFQAGSGGISLGIDPKDLGPFRNERADRFITRSAARQDTLPRRFSEKGNLMKLLDGQSFDPPSDLESVRTNRDHVELYVDQYGNPYTGGTVTENEQAPFLSATEVDIDFNVVMLTRILDGWLLHGIGGHRWMWLTVPR
ncbi:MAG: hypothetical protein M0C28_43705 [Candidatus Moduliflexus flocculans]|nr:hypothetical protein [Candidatus Moduliflexus flocculans]